MTTGVEVIMKSIRIPNTESITEFCLFDFSGRSFYRNLVRKLWSTNGPLIIVAVFDVTREESFYNMQKILVDLLKDLEKKEESVGVILGNKTDLKGRRIVSGDDAHQLAKRYKMRYFDVSAKEVQQVEEVFLHLAHIWIERQHE